MAQITAALVKQLREMTDSPMMECKKALVEADGDIEKAVDVLRTMGIAKAVKRAGRDTNEGTIATYVSEDGKTGAILELSCETDFVGTNPKFTGFAADLAKVVAEQNPADVEALKACPMNGETVDSALTEMIHVIGENMKVLRFQRVAVENGAMTGYIHLGGKLADIVVCEFSKPETGATDEFKTFAHDVAMHIAATAPVATARRHRRARDEHLQGPGSRVRQARGHPGAHGPGSPREVLQGVRPLRAGVRQGLLRHHRRPRQEGLQVSR